MPAPAPKESRVPFQSFTLTPGEGAIPPLRRALAEAAEYLAELTGSPPLPAAGKRADLVIRVSTRQDRGSPEACRITSVFDGRGVEAGVVGASALGAARGLSRLLGVIDVHDGIPKVPGNLDVTSTPRVPLRGMHLNGWAAGHPYSFRCWTEAEWLRYVDILFHEGVNLLFLWPSVDIVPVPLSREDESYLEEVRRVVAYAREERGMEVWIMHSANRVAASDCGVPDPRTRPYWLPEQVDLDPGRPDQRERILASREPLYRIVDNADGFAIIDSDPGGWLGSPVSAYLDLLLETRVMIDRLAQAGPAVKLVTWLWQGWGFQSWDPAGREHVITETILGLRERLPEPWMLISGTAHYLPWLSRLGVLDRTVALPYGAIEAEPSLPFTNVDPGSIDGALQGLAGFPGLAGIMGNVQCPLLQMPQIHHLMRSLWEGAPAHTDLDGLALLLHPGSAPRVRAAIEALNSSDQPTLFSARNGLLEILGEGQPRAGLIGRLLFPTRAQVLEDLCSQLLVRDAEAALEAALDRGESSDALAPLLTEWFRQCLEWERKHGYYGVLRVGRLGSLFPRPPIPRDTVRTWPPFVPCAIGLRRALAASDDTGGERFFQAIRAELEREYDPEKVRRGCIQAMQVMMERPEAAVAP